MNTLKLGLLVPFVTLTAASLFTGCASNPPGDAQAPTPDSAAPACSLIGCEDALQIRLDALRWGAGEYTFKFDVDGASSECNASVPWACSQDCAAPGIAFYGCTEGKAIEGVRISGSPKRVSLTIQRDGTSVANKVFEPDYQHVQPNGPQCEPICHQATENLSVIVLR
ncbi:MAG: hypothetical protein H6716_25885 [Polyangiaceae bacterium]|nr:hypothetical protein [Polyangiaceae bacterium]